MKVKEALWSATVSVALAASSVVAGPDIIEDEGCLLACDAGSLPNDAFIPEGVGTLETISGSLTGTPLTGGADFEDMYLIRIVDPVGFSATTSEKLGGINDFNTQLFLFDFDGFGLLANDDNPDDPTGGSLLLSMANDGTGQTIPGPGLYFLAITGFNDDPLSADGAPIFNQQDPTEISGPDGEGGMRPIGAWSGPGETGFYTIFMAGVEFPDLQPPAAVPVSSTLSGAVLCLVMLSVAAMAIARRMRSAI